MGYSQEAQSVADCKECETPPYNPKTDNSHYGRTCYGFDDTCSPIEDEIKNTDQLKLTYTNYPLVPLTKGSDRIFEILLKHKTYSPTHAACIKAQKDYVISELEVNKRKRAGFRRKNELDETVTSEQEDSFFDFVESLNPDFDASMLTDEMGEFFSNFKTCGNAYLKVTLMQVAGVKTCYIENVDADYCRYWADDIDTSEEIMMISPSWDQTYLHKHEPEFVSVFPNFTEDTSDPNVVVFTTIMHCKNKVETRDWYGLPDSIGSFWHQRLEVQIGEYTTKGYANEWTAKTLIETASDVSGQDPAGDFSKILGQNFTNKGKGKKYIVRNRMPEDGEMKVHELSQDNGWEGRKNDAQLAKMEIIKTHNWHEKFLGISTAGSLGQSGEREQIFKELYYNVIQPYQKKILVPFNKALMIAAEWLEVTGENGGSITDGFSVGFYNRHKDMLIAKEDGEMTDQKTVANE